MKKTNDNNSSTRRAQLATAVVLILFPLLMLMLNGQKALQGLLWKAPETLTQILPAAERPYRAQSIPDLPQLGVYDPAGSYHAADFISMEQIYISWTDFDETTLISQLREIKARKRVPMLVIEPWNGENNPATLNTDIVNGLYDDYIMRVIKVINTVEVNMYLSWGHEMDQLLTERYPWSGSDPEAYIAAYRYVVGLINTKTMNELKWIWSPVGNPDCFKYWPGPDYADFTGFPVYCYPEWERSYFGYVRSFSSWYDEKYEVVSQFGKPVIIVELGVSGSRDYRLYWLQEAFDLIRTRPEIETVVLFNSMDTPGAWGNISTPDWRIEPEMLEAILN
jgi:beta-mannanase